MSTQQFAGRRVLVTGASKGIGQAVTAILAGQGAQVVAAARKPDAALAALGEGAGSGQVLPVGVDLGEPDGGARAVAAAVEGFGGLDLLVNNVGQAEGGPRLGGFGSVTDQQWGRTLDLALMSAVRTTRAALPYLLAARGVAIVNISSINARLPDPSLVDYAAAKAALASLTKTLAMELGPQGFLMSRPGMRKDMGWAHGGEAA